MDDSGLPSDEVSSSLRRSFHQGAEEASKALAQWLGKPASVKVDALRRSPVQEAVAVLGEDEDPICFCAMEVKGNLQGEMIFAFDSASGLALASILMEQPFAESDEWTEMACSAVEETANILCCAYLNALSDSLVDMAPSPTPDADQPSSEILPGPPRFGRDFRSSLMQFVLMDQAMEVEQVVVAQTRFQIDDRDVNWTLLFVPDAETRKRFDSLAGSGRMP